MSVFDKISEFAAPAATVAFVAFGGTTVLLALNAANARLAHNSELITEMVKSGASPIEAACAIGRIDHDAPVCVMSLMSATPAGGPLPETISPGDAPPGDPT